MALLSAKNVPSSKKPLDVKNNSLVITQEVYNENI
jgi:hypothetical protein